MCSSAAQRIAEIGRAIDDLAGDAGRTAGDADPIVARLAELWALVAELDPEMAKRLAGYQSLSDLLETHIRLTAGSGLRPAERAVPAASVRGDSPSNGLLSGRRSPPQAWHSRRDAAAPRPGAPRSS